LSENNNNIISVKEECLKGQENINRF